MSLLKGGRGLPRFFMDTGFWRSMSWRGAGLAHIGLQAAAVSYCNEQETDGLLPGNDEELASALGVKVSDLRKALPWMTERGRWIKLEGGDLLIKDYLESNPSKAEITAHRRRKTEAALKANHVRHHKTERDPDCPFCSDADSDSESEPESTTESDNPSDADSKCSAVERSAVQRSAAEQESSSSVSEVPPPAGNFDDDGFKIERTLTLLATRHVQQGIEKGLVVTNRAKVEQADRRDNDLERGAEAARLLGEYPDLSAEELADAIGGRGLPFWARSRPLEPLPEPAPPEVVKANVDAARAAIGRG